MNLLFLLVIVWLPKFDCYRKSDDRISKSGFQEQFHWGLVDFKFPNASIREKALLSGSYIPANNVPFSIAVWRNKIFVSIYRLKLGIASSLNYFSTKSVTTKSPLLIPYPSFDENFVNEDPVQKTLSLTSTSSIISAGYIQIDRCDRLWVVDSGSTNFLGVNWVITAPALVIFNLKTKSVLRRYTIPANFINSNTAFTNLIIDYGEVNCQDAYAYISDMFRSLIVYSYKKNKAWSLTHNYFGSDPQAGNYFFGNINLHWNYGLFGLALGEYNRDGSRRVYVTPFTSTKTYYISNWVLQNESYVNRNHYFTDVHYLGDRGTKGQIYTMAYDNKTNVLFDTKLVREKIGCWNSVTRFIRSSFGVVYRGKKMFHPVDIKIDWKRNLWVLSARIPTFLEDGWNRKAKNIQIFKLKVDDAVAGTICSRNRKPY